MRSITLCVALIAVAGFAIWLNSPSTSRVPQTTFSPPEIEAKAQGQDVLQDRAPAAVVPNLAASESVELAAIPNLYFEAAKESSAFAELPDGDQEEVLRAAQNAVATAGLNEGDLPEFIQQLSSVKIFDVHERMEPLVETGLEEAALEEGN